MARRAWACVRLVGVAAIAVVIGRSPGHGPVRDRHPLDQRRHRRGTGAIAVVTTMCCAWRWWLVARGLGVAAALRTAVLAYYRSLFLNSALPGGVIGDLHRGVRHGRAAHDVSRGLRAVRGNAGRSGRAGVFRPRRARAAALAGPRRRAHRAREHRCGRRRRAARVAGAAALPDRVGSRACGALFVRICARQ